jgi:hypothetical protein
MKCETIADEYACVALTLFELAARLEFLSGAPGSVSVGIEASMLREVSRRMEDRAACQRVVLDRPIGSAAESMGKVPDGWDRKTIG